MKKLVSVLLILLLLCGCSVREDYYELTIDNYSISVGYDDAEYMKLIHNFDLPETIKSEETIDDVDVYLLDKLLGVASFTNSKKKDIDSNSAILTKLTIYLNDLDKRTFKINGELLDKSIKTNCDKFNGTYINKNGYACVIEQNVDNELNVIEMYGDYLNIDQDILDHIVIYVEK